MLKESNEITEAIIQLIQSLSEPQQKKIVKTISSRKRKKGDWSKKSYREKAEALIADMKKTRGRLPSNYPDKEEKLWRDASAKKFLRGYGENEPDYTKADIKEPNPEYKKWKKGK